MLRAIRASSRDIVERENWKTSPWVVGLLTAGFFGARALPGLFSRRIVKWTMR
jgi:hypothetical protein